MEHGRWNEPGKVAALRSSGEALTKTIFPGLSVDQWGVVAMGLP